MRTIKNLIALCTGIVIVTVGCGGINGIETSEIKFQDGMETSGIKFQVCRVNLATEKLPEYSYEKAITFKTRNKIEAFPQGQNELCPSGNNAFVEAVRISFNEHRPLAISPDMIWLLICQGFSNHINNNSDDLRDIFVNHKEKKEIKILRNSFIKGNPKNPWENVFPEFCDNINLYTKKDVQNLIIAEFSTTSLIDKTVFQISLMDSMQSYFFYRVVTMCGIPSIRLLGTKEDWESILNKVEAMKGYKLGWWINHLIPILEKFVEPFNGEIDKSFWSSMYKYIPGPGGSGSVPKVNGWILKFFPYLKYCEKVNMKNPFLFRLPDSSSGVEENDFPSGLSVVPFIWEYYRVEYEMNFVGGFVGISQQHGELFPQIGWFITEKSEPKK